MATERLLSPDEIDRLEAKIAAVEQITSAQLRLALTRPSWLGIKRKALRLFEQHGLARTAERNGVLIVIDWKSHEVLIYGDEGVSSRTGQDFWDDVRDAMIEEFRDGRLADGCAIGIHLIGDKLSTLFPATAAGRNELSNALIFE